MKSIRFLFVLFFVLGISTAAVSAQSLATSSRQTPPPTLSDFVTAGQAQQISEKEAKMLMASPKVKELAGATPIAASVASATMFDLNPTGFDPTLFAQVQGDNLLLSSLTIVTARVLPSGERQLLDFVRFTGEIRGGTGFLVWNGYVPSLGAFRSDADFECYFVALEQGFFARAAYHWTRRGANPQGLKVKRALASDNTGVIAIQGNFPGQGPIDVYLNGVRLSPQSIMAVFTNEIRVNLSLDPNFKFGIQPDYFSVTVKIGDSSNTGLVWLEGPTPF